MVAGTEALSGTQVLLGPSSTVVPTTSYKASAPTPQPVFDPIHRTLNRGATFRIKHPTTGQYWRQGAQSASICNQESKSLRLDYEHASVYVLNATENTYQPDQGYVNIQEIQSRLWLSESKFLIWNGVKCGQNSDRSAFKVEPTGSGQYAITSPFDGGYTLGYDTSIDQVLIVPGHDQRAVKWILEIVQPPVVPFLDTEVVPLLESVAILSDPTPIVAGEFLKKLNLATSYNLTFDVDVQEILSDRGYLLNVTDSGVTKSLIVSLEPNSTKLLVEFVQPKNELSLVKRSEDSFKLLTPDLPLKETTKVKIQIKGQWVTVHLGDKQVAQTIVSDAFTPPTGVVTMVTSASKATVAKALLQNVAVENMIPKELSAESGVNKLTSAGSRLKNADAFNGVAGQSGISQNESTSTSASGLLIGISVLGVLLFAGLGSAGYVYYKKQNKPKEAPPERELKMTDLNAAKRSSALSVDVFEPYPGYFFYKFSLYQRHF